MSYLYLDTSAIVKRYTPEIGSSWILSLFNLMSGHNFNLSEITLVEFAAALAAKERAGVITPAEQKDTLNLFLSHCTVEYNLVNVNRATINKAVQLTQNYKLRGYDAMQLATSLMTRDTFVGASITDFIFIAADNDLLKAAQAEGLTVENPNLHP